MRKSIFIFLIILLILSASPLAVLSNELSNYIDIDAVSIYVNNWNNYYEQADVPITMSINSLYDDNDSFSTFISNSGEIPLNFTNFFITYYIPDNSFAAIISGKAIDTNLKAVKIYAGDTILQAAEIENFESDGLCWEFTIDYETWTEMLKYENITLRFEKIGGVSYYTLFLPDEFNIIDYIVYQMVDALNYSSSDCDSYKDESYLPSGYENGSKDNEQSTEKNSFINDYTAIDAAAQSMFLIDVYDINGDLFSGGSGFIAFDEHYLITNYHVIDEEAAYLVVEDDKGQRSRVDQLLIADEDIDIAIFEFEEGKKYPSLPLNSKRNLMRGQPIMVIGSPKGIKNTVSNGIISAILPNKDFTEIQFTAAISPGSSGGALFNDNGEVIGLVYASHTGGENMNYAISIESVVQLQNDIKQPVALKDFNHLIKATATPKPTPKLTSTPKPTAKPTATPKSASKKELIIPVNSTAEWERINNSTIRVRIKIKNQSSTSIKAYTICYSTKKPPTSYKVKYFLNDCEKQRFEYRIYGGQTVFTDYFTVTIKSGESLYVGIRSVELSNGSLIYYDMQDIEYSQWVIK